MAEQSYAYSVSGDTANGAVDGIALDQEIRDSSIAVALGTPSVTVNLDVISVRFTSAISAADHTTLGTVVGAHTGIALPPRAICACDIGVTESTSHEYATKVSLVTPILSGAWRLQYFVLLGLSRDKHNVWIRVRETVGSTDLIECQYYFNQEDGDRVFNGYEPEIIFNNESKTFEIQLKNDGSECVRRMSHAKLDLRRVG